MFLKVQYLEGAKRRVLFDEFPPKTVWVSTHRIRVYKNGLYIPEGLIAYAWFVWEKGYKGETTLKWFN